MYYIEDENNKIVLFDEDKERLKNTLEFMPELKSSKIEETKEGYTVIDFELLTIEEAKAIENKKEKEKLAMLSLTAADVERAIYNVKGLDFEDIIENLKQNPIEGLDLKALKIELKASKFYRGNPYVSKLGAILGFSEYQLDKFFETGEERFLKE